MNSFGPNIPTSNVRPDPTSDTTINVTTNFVQPLVDSHIERDSATLSTAAHVDTMTQSQDYEHVPIEDFFLQMEDIDVPSFHFGSQIA